MFAEYTARLELFEESAREWMQGFESRAAQDGMGRLSSAMSYSLLSGGKRTRPLLGLLLAEAFGVKPQRVLPWVLAVELIHTYSLIHDDLPCMDDDDERRGRPTNHVVYGESMALLAGDTLLTEAFGLLARAYAEDPEKAIRLVALLSEAAGYHGMAGGQALDLEAQKELPDQEALLEMHARKTGALFRVICEGVAVAIGTDSQMQSAARRFGAGLGLCFQIADDILDSTPDVEKGSLPDLIGIAKTRDLLGAETEKTLGELGRLGITAGPLIEIVKWNQTRKA